MMDKSMTELERELVTVVRRHLEAAAISRSPVAVVDAVIAQAEQQRPWWRSPIALVGAVAALGLVVAVVGLAYLRLGDGLTGGSGSKPATATVDGRDYFLGVGRSLVVADADLQPYGRITRAGPDWFEGRTAYRLAGVEPAEALVTDAPDYAGGAWGDFAILWGSLDGMHDPSAALCAYFDPGDRPDGCLADSGLRPASACEERAWPDTTLTCTEAQRSVSLGMSVWSTRIWLTTLAAVDAHLDPARQVAYHPTDPETPVWVFIYDGRVRTITYEDESGQLVTSPPETRLLHVADATDPLTRQGRFVYIYHWGELGSPEVPDVLPPID